MSELWILIALILLLAGLMISIRRKENRRLKSRTGESLSSKLRVEIEVERAESLKRKEKFEEALQSASGKTRDDLGGAG